MDRRDELLASIDEHKKFISRGELSWERYAASKAGAGAGATITHNGAWWSTVQTVLPHLYFQRPPTRVTRRLLQARRDPVSIAACEIAERNTELQLECQDFDGTMLRLLETKLITGRGVAWVGYEPKIEEVELQLMPTIDPGILASVDGRLFSRDSAKEKNGIFILKEEQLIDERVFIENIHWRDFVHSVAREWNEVEWVARRLYLSKDKAKELVGKKKADDLEYSEGYETRIISSGADSKSREMARLWEMYDKEAGYVCYYTEDGEKLAEKEPPIDFKDFFPCPKPLLGTYSDESLVPMSDFEHIRAELETLNVLNEQYQGLAKKVRYAGVYNAEFGTAFANVWNTSESKHVALTNWATFSQTGGLQGNKEDLPFRELAETLQILEGRILTINTRIFETLGVSDLMRGQDQSQATATAQGIKQQYGNTRLSADQRDVANMIADVVELACEAVVEKLEPATLAQGAGMDVQDQVFPQALKLLRNDKLRTFAIEIDTEATKKGDEEAEKQSIVEFGQQFMGQIQMFDAAMQVSPERAELSKEVILLTLQRFKAGRQVESKIDDILTSEIEQRKQQIEAQKNQPPPPPPPELLLIQAETKLKEATAQAKAQEAAIKQAEMQMKQTETQAEMQLKQLELQEKQTEARLKEAELQIKRIEAATKVQESAAKAGKLEAETDAEYRDSDRKDAELLHEIQSGVQEPNVSRM